MRSILHNLAGVLPFVLMVAAAAINGYYVIAVVLAVGGVAMNCFTWRK